VIDPGEEMAVLRGLGAAGAAEMVKLPHRMGPLNVNEIAAC